MTMKTVAITDQPVTYVGLQHAQPGDFAFIEGEPVLITKREEQPYNREMRRATGLAKAITFHKRRLKEPGIGRICPICGDENCGHEITVDD